MIFFDYLRFSYVFLAYDLFKSRGGFLLKLPENDFARPCRLTLPLLFDKILLYIIGGRAI